MNAVLNSQGYGAAWWDRIPSDGLGIDGIDRNFLQFSDRLWRSSRARAHFVDSSGHRIDFVLSYCGYRQPPRRRHQRASPESNCDLSVHEVTRAALNPYQM